MFNFEDNSKQLFSSNEMLNKSFQQIFPETAANNFALSKSQMIHLRESPQARARRLARNAERMREKRAKENFDEVCVVLQCLFINLFV